MDKALDMGKSSATGSYHLLIGVAVSTIIMSLGTIILNSLLPREGVGLYGVVLIPSSMINFFRDWGVNSAMTKQIASLRAEKREAEIHDVIVSGIIFEVISGTLLALGCFIASGLLASYLVPGVTEAPMLIGIMSLSIFASAIMAAATAIFVGFEKMMLNSLATILQAVVKTVIGPILVVLGFSVFGAVVGTTLSIFAGAAIGIVIVYIAVFRPIQKQKTGKCEIIKNLKPMIAYGVPLTVSNLVIGVMPLMYAFVMTPIAGTSLMGDYYTTTLFAVLLTFFTIPIATTLFPTFAKINAEAEPELLKTMFASSVKYASIIVVPATIAVMALSTPMINTLWPGKYPYAPLFLSVTVIVNLLAVVGNISLGTFMTGIGKTGNLMMQSLLSLGCGAPLLAYLYLSSKTLAPLEGATIGIIGIIFSAVPGTIWGLYWAWKNYKVKADFRSSAKILAASGFAGIATFVLLTIFLPVSTGFASAEVMAASRLLIMFGLAIGLALFLVLYLTIASLIGAINQTDVKNFRSMFSGVPVVSKILEIPLRFIQKIIRLRYRKSET